MNRITRRRFLRAAAAGGVAYAFARTPGVAYAQMSGGGSFTDYKALVCVFLFGGNDSWNMVVPRSTTQYNAYRNSRQNLAIAQNTLLPLNLAVADPEGWQYGLHPSMTGLQSLFNAGRAAFVANVGPLVAPTTLDQYLNGSVPLPPQLFSHNDQQDQWHSLKGRAVLKTGWAGRAADVLMNSVANQTLPMNISLAGQTLYQAGGVAVPYTVGAEGPTPFSGFGTTGVGLSRRQAFLGVVNGNYDTVYARGFADVQQRAIQYGENVSAVLARAPNLGPALPDAPTTPLSPLATQLRTVGKLIAMRNELQMSRQIFFVSIGGFDVHDNQLGVQPSQLLTVSNALQRFDQALQQLNISQNVVTFTQSEFGRTLTSNGDGTDHAWGGIQVVTGGAVNGGRIYGNYPLLRLNARRGTDRADDVGGGRFIPTLSTDQYVATLARWFGVSDTNMPQIARSINNFTVRNLGFLR